MLREDTRQCKLLAGAACQVKALRCAPERRLSAPFLPRCQARSASKTRPSLPFWARFYIPAGEVKMRPAKKWIGRHGPWTFFQDTFNLTGLGFERRNQLARRIPVEDGTGCRTVWILELGPAGFTQIPLPTAWREHAPVSDSSGPCVLNFNGSSDIFPLYHTRCNQYDRFVLTMLPVCLSVLVRNIQQHICGRPVAWRLKHLTGTQEDCGSAPLLGPWEGP